MFKFIIQPVVKVLGFTPQYHLAGKRAGTVKDLLALVPSSHKKHLEPISDSDAGEQKEVTEVTSKDSAA
jgi:hypothetical protein